MEEHPGFSFDDFSIEMEDFEYKQVKSFDRIWRVTDGGSLAQKPLVHEGVVYVGALDHNVYAIDAQTGKMIWKFKTQDRILAASPVYFAGLVCIGSFDQNFYALDAKTGEMRWKFKTEGNIIANAHVENGKVYFGSMDHNLYCLDASNGRLIWRFRTQGEVLSVPTIYGNRLFFGSYDRNLYCLDAETGKPIWKFGTQGNIFSQIEFLVKDDIIYFCSFDNYLRAVDVNTAKLIWKFLTGHYGGMIAGPKILGNMLIQSNREGVIRALTFAGKQIWEFRINNAMANNLVHGDRVYFGAEDQNLHCLDSNGKELWTFKTQGYLWWEPTVAGDKVYFTSWDCNLYCVDINTHELVWKFRAQGAPAYMPPPFESYELVVKKPVEEAGLEERGTRKKYEMDIKEEESGSFYKSRITYQVSTQYQSRGGKYQVDSDEEAL